MDPHKLLQVAEGCAPAELDRRYKELARLFHPDRMGSDPTASVVFQLIQEAYRRLKGAGSAPAPIVLSRGPEKGSGAQHRPQRAAAPHGGGYALGERLHDPYFSTEFSLESYFDDVPVRRKK